MQLALGDAADDIAARGRRGPRALEHEPRLGGVELGARGVQDDGELADLGPEPLLQPRAGVLELGEDALGVLRVALVMAGDERLGGGLEPGHGRGIVACAAAM